MRNQIEFNAFLCRVRNDLRSAHDGETSDWRSRGERFFKTIIRARFGTSDPDKQKVLEEAGIPSKSLKPFNVRKCIETLSNIEHCGDIGARYDLLCDFVHHNLSSQTISTDKMSMGRTSRSRGGGMIMTTQQTPIVTYTYPSPPATAYAISTTSPGAALDTGAAVTWLNEIPDSAFRRTEVIEHIGSDGWLRKPQPPMSEQKVGRNHPCPCGSGKKFKYCCLAPRS